MVMEVETNVFRWACMEGYLYLDTWEKYLGFIRVYTSQRGFPFIRSLKVQEILKQRKAEKFNRG